MKKIKFFLLIVLLISFTFPQSIAEADVAPPEAPPGTNLIPGNEQTQVRMMAEIVTLTISENPSDSNSAIAKTEAVFTMRNLGIEEEKMQVRFPLSFFNGNSDGWGNFPEIDSIVVKVDGKNIQTKKENQPFFQSENSYEERQEIPWAVFDVSFPPSQDVTIEVVYDVHGYGYYPYEVFKYILETGAGWNGTIGSADIIVRLPYEVNEKNLDLSSQIGYADGTTPLGGVINKNEIRWKFEDFEPTAENNFHITVVTPSLWGKVLKEKAVVEKNPNDGEAWGRLAKAYKEILVLPKYMRSDPAALEILQLSTNAYQRCLELLPNDSLWHYGYADLLLSHFIFNVYSKGKEDAEGILPIILLHLQTALELDSNNQQAKDLLIDISYIIPGAVSMEGDNFVFLGLTATPIPPTPYLPPSETPQSTVEIVSTPTQQIVATSTNSSPQPVTQNPLCGGAFLLPALFGLVFVLKKRI